MKMNVKILSVYGTQEDIVTASRVCTGNEDKSLASTPKQIESLLRKKHWKPFEFAEITVEINAPIYVMRQWMRHSGSFLEKSRRYTVDAPEFYDAMSADETEDATFSYEHRLFDGDKPEDARVILPLGLMTKVLWKVNLRDLMSFFRQRLELKAQKEIRELAEDLLCQTYKHFPDVVDAFLTHDFVSVPMGADEIFDMFFLLEHGAFAYAGSQKRLQTWGDNAKKRLQHIKRLFEKIAESIPDSGGDSGSGGSSLSDDKQVSEKVRTTEETGTEKGNTSMERVRKMAETEQGASAEECAEDSGDKQLQLPFGEELSLQTEAGEQSVIEDEALGGSKPSNIVEGHFGANNP